MNSTVIMDEVNRRPSNDVLDILRDGHSRSGKVFRCGGKDSSYDLQVFPSFSPKVIAGQAALEDGALASRCILENMGANKPASHIRDFLPQPEFDNDTRELQGRLLRWTLDTFHAIDYQGIDVPGDHRQQQVFRALYSVTPEKHRPTLRALADRHEKSVAESNSDSDEAAVVACLVSMKEPEKFYPGDVAENINSMRGVDDFRSPDALSARKVGGLLKRVGIVPISKRDNKGCPYGISRDRLEELAAKLGVST
jgi:hypothetical protein